jgi:uncharacterized membrane protein YidH (DUF202 family)
MRDAGVQPERTELAWTRTALSLAAVAALLLRLSFGRAAVVQCAAVVTVAAAAVVVRVTSTRAYALRCDPTPSASPRSILTIAASALIADLGAVLLVVTG